MLETLHQNLMINQEKEVNIKCEDLTNKNEFINEHSASEEQGISEQGRLEQDNSDEQSTANNMSVTIDKQSKELLNLISGNFAPTSQIVTHGEKIPRDMIDASSQATNNKSIDSSCQTISSR